MTKLVLLLIAILICGLTFACAAPITPVPAQPSPAQPVPPPPATSTPAPPPTPTQVVTIDIGLPLAKNWDADPEIDGVEFNLTPKDAQDKMVRTPGTLSAQLWLEKSFLEGGGKGLLVQQWSGIQLTKDDYDIIFGARIRLEYRAFKPGMLQFGVLEVTLETPDGKSFTARATSVLLGE